MQDHAPRSPFVPVLMAWLVPGGGHFLLGRPWPALFVALGVLPLFILGLHLTGYEIVSPVRHAWYFATQVWAGLPTGFAALLTTDVVISEPLPFQEAGRLYTAVAGMLNLMAIADVWARCGRSDPESLVTASGSPTADSAVAAGPDGATGPDGTGGAFGSAPAEEATA